MREKAGKGERGVGLERRREGCRERERKTEREGSLHNHQRDSERKPHEREPLSRMVPERKP